MAIHRVGENPWEQLARDAARRLRRAEPLGQESGGKETLSTSPRDGSFVFRSWSSVGRTGFGQRSRHIR